MGTLLALASEVHAPPHPVPAVQPFLGRCDSGRAWYKVLLYACIVLVSKCTEYAIQPQAWTQASLSQALSVVAGSTARHLPRVRQAWLRYPNSDAALTWQSGSATRSARTMTGGRFLSSSNATNERANRNRNKK